MRKYTLKRLLPCVIVAGVLAVVAIVGFIFMPLIDGMIKQGPTLFDQFTYLDGIVGAFREMTAFDTTRAIISFVIAVVVIAMMIAWFIVILVKKHYKKLIIWGIELVLAIVFVVFVTIIFAGTRGDQFAVEGNWIYEIGFSEELEALKLTCKAGAIVGFVVGVLSALGLIDLIISFIVDLVPQRQPKEAKSLEEEINEAYEARVAQEAKEEQVSQTVYAETKEEKVVKAAVVEPKVSGYDDHIRRIVHDECEILYLRLIKAKAFNTEKNEEEKIVIKEEHVVRDESATDDEYYSRMISELGMFNGKKPAPAPVAKPVVKEVKKPAPAPAPVKKPAPVAKPVVAASTSEKIIRIPFEKRIVEADKVMKDHFNELKSEILSYGVKSRVSNSGDTFRLHTVTFVKMTIAGKSLKLYLALNPKDYKDSTLPIADASKKSIYKEIPLVFKVKSELSLRRAKQLIADAMAKGGLTQGEVVPHDWVKEIKNGNF